MWLRALEVSDGQEMAGGSQSDDLLQFVPAELHGHGAEHDPKSHGGKVDRDILGHIRKLGDQDVVAFQAEVHQAQGVTRRARIKFFESEAQRRPAGQRLPVRRVDHGHSARV